jgi:hypothetical protein
MFWYMSYIAAGRQEMANSKSFPQISPARGKYGFSYVKATVQHQETLLNDIQIFLYHNLRLH